ncbi:MAG: acetyl-CoA carboxylase biotin carboxyl carrier protein [Candidatus Omnitrophica bacterium]|nr:acetyl-CoA carboxylase biotin carboxyl carrier protein [Candidatus Omnitrophota bacterium]
MNIKEIKEMISLMNENHLTELELEKNGLKIRLRKGYEGVIEREVEKVVPRISGGGIEKFSSAEPAAAHAAQMAVEIKSPMVGTFYKAPAPDAQAYVKVGDNIEAGQVVCIIEAMKLMNEIKSEIKGKIVSVLVENADPVEFGQTLFLVEPL